LVTIPFKIGPVINYSNATPGAGSYEALKIAVTETALPTGTNYLIRASAGAAGTTDKFNVTNGSTTMNIIWGGVNDYLQLGGASGSMFGRNNNGMKWQMVAADTVEGLRLNSTASVSWNSTTDLGGGSRDVYLYRDAASTLALRNSTAAQTFRLYETYTDASNYERGVLTMGSNALVLAFESAGTGSADGDIVFTPKGSGTVKFGTHSAVAAEIITGYITITDAAGNSRKLAVIS
jgi:hypothetical protein